MEKEQHQCRISSTTSLPSPPPMSALQIKELISRLVMLIHPSVLVEQQNTTRPSLLIKLNDHHFFSLSLSLFTSFLQHTLHDSIEKERLYYQQEVRDIIAFLIIPSFSLSLSIEICTFVFPNCHYKVHMNRFKKKEERRGDLSHRTIQQSFLNHQFIHPFNQSINHFFFNR